jgi:predicted  nucleic acid-binding Zn-ribbon protein
MKPNAFASNNTKAAMRKHTSWILAFLPIAAFVAGCNREQTASQQLDHVTTDIHAAAKDMKDYAFAQRSEFVASMQAQLDTLNKELDQLSAKIETSSDTTKAEGKPKLQALRTEVSQLSKQLDNVRNATESTWDSVKATSQKAFASVKSGFQQSRQWVSDKIAPSVSQ